VGASGRRIAEYILSPVSDASPSLLVAAFVVWASACVGLAVMFVRRAPAVTLALSGSVLGAIAGFLVGNADGPAEVPAYTAVGASIGLFTLGVLGTFTTVPRGPARSLRRAALVLLVVAPFAAAALTLLLQVACPLYTSGKDSGFCNYQRVDLLGGWVSGVIAAFLFDAVFVAALLFVSGWQAGSRSDTISNAERCAVTASDRGSSSAAASA
jgi:hypothetical protein